VFPGPKIISFFVFFLLLYYLIFLNSIHNNATLSWIRKQMYLIDLIRIRIQGFIDIGYCFFLQRSDSKEQGLACFQRSDSKEQGLELFSKIWYSVGVNVSRSRVTCAYCCWQKNWNFIGLNKRWGVDYDKCDENAEIIVFGNFLRPVLWVSTAHLHLSAPSC
jgi:hypothetical protein